MCKIIINDQQHMFATCDHNIIITYQNKHHLSYYWRAERSLRLLGGQTVLSYYWWADYSVRLPAGRPLSQITGGQTVLSYYWRADRSIILLAGRPFYDITGGQTVLSPWEPHAPKSSREQYLKNYKAKIFIKKKGGLNTGKRPKSLVLEKKN